MGFLWGGKFDYGFVRGVLGWEGVGLNEGVVFGGGEEGWDV